MSSAPTRSVSFILINYSIKMILFLLVGQKSLAMSYPICMTPFAVFEQNFLHCRLKSARALLQPILQSAPKSRPIGVTIIAILNIIGGVLMLFFGIGLITLGAVLPTLPPSVFNQSQLQGNLTAGQASIPPGPPPMVLQSLLVFGVAIGAVLVAIAIVSFIVAYGLLKGRGWAWTVSVILSIISIVSNAVSIATTYNFGGIVGIIISGIILYYLYRPHVKAYFGKGVSPPPSAA